MAVSLCFIFCGILLAICETAATERGTQTKLDINVSNTKDDDLLTDYLRTRRKRSIFGIAKALVTSREATRKILKGAKEILPEEGSYNKHYADISKGFKKYIKEGGRKQAYKDLSEFKGAHTHVYPIPDGGTGTWAIMGDRVIILESRGSETALIIKQGAGTPKQHIDKIIYKD